MKKLILICVVVVLFMVAGQGFGIDFNDGGIHSINYSEGNVYVDNGTPGMYTKVNLLNGGYIHKFFAYQDSRINISGGRVGLSLVAYDRTQVIMTDGQIWYLDAYDSSQATMSGGTATGDLIAKGSSHVTMSGGTATGDLIAKGSSHVTMSGVTVMGYLEAGDSSHVTMSGGSVLGMSVSNSSQVTISGGTIGSDGFLELVASGNGKLIINGSNFAIDGISLGFGEITSIFGGVYENEPYRRLTGTLANGDIINNRFQIGNNAKIVLIPEPATIALLFLGGLVFRKKH